MTVVEFYNSLYQTTYYRAVKNWLFPISTLTFEAKINLILLYQNSKSEKQFLATILLFHYYVHRIFFGENFIAHFKMDLSSCLCIFLLFFPSTNSCCRRRFRLCRHAIKYGLWSSLHFMNYKGKKEKCPNIGSNTYVHS